MAGDITAEILREIESDLNTIAMDICLDIESRGLFKKTRTLHIHGTVRSQDQMSRIESITKRHAGSLYEVVNHLGVK